MSGDKGIVSLSLAVNCEVIHKEYFHVHFTGTVGPHRFVKNSLIKHHESTITGSYLLSTYLRNK